MYKIKSILNSVDYGIKVVTETIRTQVNGETINLFTWYLN